MGTKSTEMYHTAGISMEYDSQVFGDSEREIPSTPKSIWGRLFCWQKKPQRKIAFPSPTMPSLSNREVKINKSKTVKKMMSNLFFAPEERDAIHRLLSRVPKQQRNKAAIHSALTTLRDIPVESLAAVVQLLSELPRDQILFACNMLGDLEPYQKKIIKSFLHTAEIDRTEHLLCAIKVFQSLGNRETIYTVIKSFGGVHSSTLKNVLLEMEKNGLNRHQTLLLFVAMFERIYYIQHDKFLSLMVSFISIFKERSLEFIHLLETYLTTYEHSSLHPPCEKLLELNQNELEQFLKKLQLLNNISNFKTNVFEFSLQEQMFELICARSWGEIAYVVIEINNPLAEKIDSVHTTLEHILFISFYLTAIPIRSACKFCRELDQSELYAFIRTLKNLPEADRPSICSEIVHFVNTFEETIKNAEPENLEKTSAFSATFQKLPLKLRNKFGQLILLNDKAEHLCRHLLTIDLTFANEALHWNPILLAAFIQSEKGKTWLRTNFKDIEAKFSDLLAFALQVLPPNDANYAAYPPKIIFTPVFANNTLCRITVARSFVINDPLGIATAIHFNLPGEFPDQLHVRYLGELGADDGGLTRDFLSNFFRSAVAQKFIVNNWPTWKEGVPADYLKRFFETIGYLFAFIVRTEGAYPIGEIFGPHFYIAIQEFTLRELREPFRNLSLAKKIFFLCRLGPILYEGGFVRQISNFFIANTILDIEKTINPIKELYASLEEEIPSDYLDTEGNIDPAKVLQYKENFHKEVYEKVNIAYHFDDQLKALFYIAKRLFNTNKIWKYLKGIENQALITTIQGQLDRQLLVEATTYVDTEKEFVNAMTTWIQSTDEKILRNFLDYMTGSPAMSQKTKISLKTFKVDKNADLKLVKIYAHSCSGHIDLPDKTYCETFIEFLNSFSTRVTDGFAIS